MTARLPTHLTVSALLRRVNDAGGIGMVRARGDAQAGTLLFLLTGPDGVMRALERRRGLDDVDTLMPAGPADAGESDLEIYWRQRRRNDPDLWVIELDGAGVERFVAETIGVD